MLFICVAKIVGLQIAPARMTCSGGDFGLQIDVIGQTPIPWLLHHKFLS